MYRYVRDEERIEAKKVSFSDFMLSEYPLDAMKESKNSSRWRNNPRVVFTANGYYLNSKGGYEHGDGIEFLMKYKELEYPEAVAKLYAYAKDHNKQKGGVQ